MRQTIRAVDRALDVLMCFSRQIPELTLTQISDRVGIHKSTVHRLLATLQAKHFVERDIETGAYRLGINMFQMTYPTLNYNDLRSAAAPYLHQLNEQYRESVNLSFLDGVDVIHLDVVESPQQIKLAGAIGQRLPAFCTATGKAILAFSPKELVHRIIERGMHQYTETTLDSPEIFFENLKQTQQRGFAMSLEEFEDGINAVAAPILTQDAQPIASIAVAGPSYRLSQERMLEIGLTLLDIVHEIAVEAEITTNS